MLTKKLHILLLGGSALENYLRPALRGFEIAEITVTALPDDALRHLADHPVDLAFVAMEISGSDGFEFVDRVRHSADILNPLVRIALMGPHANSAMARRAIAAGADEILVTALPEADLRERLVALLARRQDYITTAKGYFGPDRRQLNDTGYDGPERRRLQEGRLAADGASLPRPAKSGTG